MIAGQGKFANAETQLIMVLQLVDKQILNHSYNLLFVGNTPQPMPGTNNISKLKRSI